MSTETLLNYIDAYGYLIIFITLFFGIVGIPAPEESFLLLVGTLAAQDTLSIQFSLICAIFGAFTGMLTAYTAGRYIGHSLIYKFGKYVGITEERWNKVVEKYSGNLNKAIIIGFFIPGARQIIPYFAGTARFCFWKFCTYSIVGSIIWVVPYTVFGYYAASVFNINPKFVPYIGIVFMGIFIVVAIVKIIRRNK